MNKKRISFFILPVLIIVFGMACNLSGGPTPPRQVTNSPELAKSVEASVQTVQPNPTTGKIQYTITEAEMTSYVNQNLSKNFDPILKNPVVVFQPDRLELYGTISGDNISANGRVAMSVDVDDQGKPSVKITEANFGPIPVPASLLTNLSTAIDRSLEDAMTQNNSDYRLESIKITTGSATVTLRKK